MLIYNLIKKFDKSHLNPESRQVTPPLMQSYTLQPLTNALIYHPYLMCMMWTANIVTRQLNVVSTMITMT